MKDEKDYIRDITEMRHMMERSSRFLSLSGLSGILAGVYALAGAALAYFVFDFNPQKLIDPLASYASGKWAEIFAIAFIVLTLTLSSAILLSFRKARKKQESIWNQTARRLLFHLAVPLFTGGTLIIILIVKGLTGLAAPLSLIFYGLAIFNASKFTFEEMKSLGLVQVCLGLVASFFIEYGLLIWAIGFGIVHIIYGIYMYNRYER